MYNGISFAFPITAVTTYLSTSLFTIWALLSWLPHRSFTLSLLCWLLCVRYSHLLWTQARVAYVCCKYPFPPWVSTAILFVVSLDKFLSGVEFINFLILPYPRTREPSHGFSFLHLIAVILSSPGCKPSEENSVSK